MICPQCGFENRESAKFCLKCAQQLVALGHDVGAAVAPTDADDRKHRRSRLKQKARRAAEKLAALKPQRTAHHDGDTVFLEPAYSEGDTVLLEYSSEAPDSVSAPAEAHAPHTDAASGATALRDVAPHHPAPHDPTPLASATPVNPVARATPHPWSRYAIVGGLATLALGWAVYAMTAHQTPDTVPADTVAQASVAPAPSRPIPPPVEAASDGVLILPRLEPIGPETKVPPPPITKAAPAVAEQPSAKRPPTRRTPPPAPTATVVAQPVAPPPAPPQAAASEPAKRTPPATLCADSSFLSHEMCLQRECSSASMRQNPQCVRMRDRQKLLREGVGDGRF